MKIKKMLSLLLAGVMMLSMVACGAQGGGSGADPAAGGTGTYEKYEVAKVKLPEIPEKPSYADVENALAALDYDKLGEAKYTEESNKIMDGYAKKQSAYEEAMVALRGDGVEPQFDGPMYGFTQNTANTIFGEMADKNVAYSPANLYMALCMLCEVTDGESRAQIMNLLGLNNIEEVRASAGQLWRNLYLSEEGSKTLLANSMWLNENINFKEETIKKLAENYYASGFSVPMGEKETDEALRAWINENTGGLLEDAAGSIETDPMTVLALVSTIYFKDGWCHRFEPSLNTTDDFTSADGKKAQTEFMHYTENHGGYFHSNEGYTIAELPMESGLSMRFFLPDEDKTLAAFQDKNYVIGSLLSYEAGIAIKAGKIKWSVPKFDVQSDIDMKGLLYQMNIRDIFDKETANFSPLAELDEQLVVTDIKHAGRVKIDEEGCEAAAFTSIMVEATSMMPQDLPVIEMNLNRPFAFMITGADGMPLFTGMVNQI